jgi:hypothetical protein
LIKAVRCNQLLDLLELFPGNIAFMVLWNQGSSKQKARRCYYNVSGRLASS